MKEYKVGQIVTINGTKTRVTKKDNTLCTGCIFKKYSPLCERYCCGHLERSDHNDVIFAPLSSTHKAINKEKGYDKASLVANFYKEIKLPQEPKDKELVWCWDTTYTCGKLLKFYDGKHRDTYRFNGMRDGMRYKHYAPYKGEYPQWAKDAQKRLED